MYRFGWSSSFGFWSDPFPSPRANPDYATGAVARAAEKAALAVAPDASDTAQALGSAGYGDVPARLTARHEYRDVPARLTTRQGYAVMERCLLDQCDLLRSSINDAVRRGGAGDADKIASYGKRADALEAAAAVFRAAAQSTPAPPPRRE